MTPSSRFQNNEAPILGELRRLRWSQSQLAQASQTRPEVISRLVTRKVTSPYAETRKRVMVALRQRAQALGLPAPDEISLFPWASQPITSHEHWQHTLVQYACQLNWAHRLAHELEPVGVLRLRFDVAHRALEQAPPRTFEQWEDAADLLFYAVQRAAQGEPHALQEAKLYLRRACLPWEATIVAALAKYQLLSDQAEKEVERIWRSIASSLQSLEQAGEPIKENK